MTRLKWKINNLHFQDKRFKICPDQDRNQTWATRYQVLRKQRKKWNIRNRLFNNWLLIKSQKNIYHNLNEYYSQVSVRFRNKSNLMIWIINCISTMDLKNLEWIEFWILKSGKTQCTWICLINSFNLMIPINKNLKNLNRKNLNKFYKTVKEIHNYKKNNWY